MTKQPTRSKNTIDHKGKIRRSIPWRSGALLAIAVAAAVLCRSTYDATGSAAPLAVAPVTATVTVSPDLPGDIHGGAAGASLEQAAMFAWQEFIALTWPAAKRGEADRTARYGTSGPVVWETFRGKVEIFPGFGLPHGNTKYDDPPDYRYNPVAVGYYPQLLAGRIPSCNGAESAVPPFVNLDEDSQILLNRAFARSRDSSAAFQIMFSAKANRTHYEYIRVNNWFLLNLPPVTATAAFVAQQHKSPTAGDLTGNAQLVSFPNGTIETKAAWRRLTKEEAASGRFYTAPVRYYQRQKSESGYGGNHQGDPAKSCYVDEPAGSWGLIGLHIIHKTPTAPYFVYATFEQADNLVDAKGNPIENTAGETIGASELPAFDPDITSQPAVGGQIATADSVQRLSLSGSGQPPASPRQPGASYGLSFVENKCAPSAPQGDIHVNHRKNSIPRTIISVNRDAQATIRRDNPAAPWQYYKLVNVQYRPIDKPVPGQDYPGNDKAEYYLANIAIESDYNLQMFSGSFQGGTQDDGSAVVDLHSVDVPGATKDINNLITDFSIDGSPFKNVQYDGRSYIMGGCMGCHGNIQALGNDFSFMLGNGSVDHPRPEGGTYDCAPTFGSGPSPATYRPAATNAKWRDRR